LCSEAPGFAWAVHTHLLDVIGRQHPQRWLWFDNAMSSVERGAAVVDAIARRRPIGGIRYLDAGAQLRGFAIAFSRAGAKESIGLETNPTSVRLGSALLADHRSTARLVEGSV